MEYDSLSSNPFSVLFPVVSMLQAERFKWSQKVKARRQTPFPMIKSNYLKMMKFKRIEQDYWRNISGNFEQIQSEAVYFLIQLSRNHWNPQKAWLDFTTLEQALFERFILPGTFGH